MFEGYLGHFRGSMEFLLF